MKCPVCGKEHEEKIIRFGGHDMTLIPCPEVDRDRPFVIREKVEPIVIPKEPCPLCQKPTPCEHTAWIDDMIVKGK